MSLEAAFKDSFAVQVDVLVGTSDTPLVPYDHTRVALVINAQAPTPSQSLNQSQLVHNADTTATGVKLSYTVPANTQAVLSSASFFVTTGTPPTSQLQLVRGGVTVVLSSGTANADLTAPVPLSAGDVVQWNCTVAGAASTSDYTLGVVQERVAGRVTLSLENPAVLDSGVDMDYYDPPLVLTIAHHGRLVQGPIRAIAAGAAVIVTYWSVGSRAP